MDDVDFNLVYVLADASKLGQVMRNFLSNALKCTPSGGQVTVHLSLANEGNIQQEKILCIAVTDAGPGMSREELPSVFRKSSLLDQGQLQSDWGFGMGLYSTLSSSITHPLLCS